MIYKILIIFGLLMWVYTGYRMWETAQAMKEQSVPTREGKAH